jgi:hypothetical protein
LFLLLDFSASRQWPHAVLSNSLDLCGIWTWDYSLADWCATNDHRITYSLPFIWSCV